MGIVSDQRNHIRSWHLPGKAQRGGDRLSTSVAPGSKPRSAIAAAPVGPDWAVPLLLDWNIGPIHYRLPL